MLPLRKEQACQNAGMKTRVLHLITGLPVGGTQMMLAKLLSAMDRNTFENEVASLEVLRPMAQTISSLGIPVTTLGIRSGRLAPRKLARFLKWLRHGRFDVVQTWMYHADLIGGIAAKLCGGIPVVWGIRQSNLEPRHNKRSTLWIVRACARLSGWLPRRVVCCSEVARRAHARVGYAENKLEVIPNGFDLDTFRPDPEAGSALRRELGLPSSAMLVGNVARFDSQKDHQTFVRAASLLTGDGRELHFVLCGENMDPANTELARWIGDAGIAARCHLLGLRRDVASIHAALDIEVCSSVSEGFSNAIGEAMACEVPCASTDVGDSALLIGDTGRVVPPQDPLALANACRELMEIGVEGRRRLGQAARRRIAERFSLPAIAARYESLYRELATHVRH
jgi:glycosyltransferase involved in cell wall biosynthesis